MIELSDFDGAVLTWQEALTLKDALSFGAGLLNVKPQSEVRLSRYRHGFKVSFVRGKFETVMEFPSSIVDEDP